MPEGVGIYIRSGHGKSNIPLRYVHLILCEETKLHSPLQSYVDIYCGFEFWAVLFKKEMIVDFSGFSGTISSQVIQLRK